MSLAQRLKNWFIRTRVALTGYHVQPAPPSSRWDRAGAVANVVVAGAAIAALLVALAQAGEARQQSAIAAAALAGQTRQTDLEAVGAVSVAANRKSDTLAVTNTSTFPLLESALWVFGASEDEVLREVTVPVSGIPSCRAMVMPLTQLLRAADVVSDLELIEVQIAVQAPSGAWYLIADSGQIEPIDGEHSAPLEALKRSHGYQVAGDTFTGGFSSEDPHVIDYPITAGRAVSGYSPVQAEIQTAGCS